MKRLYMKRLIAVAMVGTIGLGMLAGCGTKKTDNKPEAEAEKPAVTQEVGDRTASNNQEQDGPKAKVAVNISGTVEEVSEDGMKIKVDGKWIIITENTRFEDDPDNGIEPVAKEFKVGNEIVGWTAGDPDADEVTADAIYSNN